jgi:hypothetical protein
MLLAFAEEWVAEADGVLAFGHFAEVIHVELCKWRITCRRNDL